MFTEQTFHVKIQSQVGHVKSFLTLSPLMFPFDPPENIRKHQVFYALILLKTSENIRFFVLWSSWKHQVFCTLILLKTSENNRFFVLWSSWKHQKTSGFLSFGGTKGNIGKNRVKVTGDRGEGGEISGNCIKILSCLRQRKKCQFQSWL